MYAYEIPGLHFSLPAGGAVAQHRFVSVASEQAIQATAATQIVGASMNEVTTEESTRGGYIIEIADGIVMVEAAGEIASGAAVYSDASGKATTTGTIVAGVAITAASGAGQLIAVKL